MIRIATQVVLALAMQASSDEVFSAGFEDAQFGLMDVRSVYASLGKTPIVGYQGGGTTFPVACRSQPYVAGPNESAIVQLTASLQSDAPLAAFMYPGVGSDGGPMQRIGNMPAAASLVPAANLTSMVRTPLVPGVTYVFGIGLNGTSSFDATFVYCQGSIQIVKQLN